MRQLIGWGHTHRWHPPWEPSSHGRKWLILASGTYLEDHLLGGVPTWRIIPFRKWVITMVSFRPQFLGLWDPNTAWQWHPSIQCSTDLGRLARDADTPLPLRSAVERRSRRPTLPTIEPLDVRLVAPRYTPFHPSAHKVICDCRLSVPRRARHGSSVETLSLCIRVVRHYAPLCSLDAPGTCLSRRRCCSRWPGTCLNKWLIFLGCDPITTYVRPGSPSSKQDAKMTGWPFTLWVDPNCRVP